MRAYHVYIMASVSGVVYVGVTGDLERRVGEHKQGRGPGFTKRYRVKKLVYVEEYDDIEAALAREKQLKGWRRAKKVALVEAQNPTWRDYGAGW